MKAEKNYEVKVDKIKTAVNSCELMISANKLCIEYLRSESSNDLVAIAAFTDPISQQKEQLMKSLSEAEEVIANKVKIPTPAIIDAPSMCVMVQDLRMAMLQGWGLINSSKTQIINDAYGSSINKDYLIRRMRTVMGEGNDAVKKSLEERYEVLTDRTIKQDDPGADMLLIAESDMNSLLESYSEAIGDKADQVRKDFRQFVGMCDP